MADVFISYSRKDKEFVQRLDDALRQRDREAWVDWEGIRPTEEFMQAIYSAIEGADTFIFILSPDSVSSVVCGKEIAHAVAQNKRMVPLVARDVNAADVPEALAKLNWIFCRESDDFEKSTASLITALDTDLDWVRAHTRLLTRAVEWEAHLKSNSFMLRGEDLQSAERWLAQAGTDEKRQPTSLQTEYIISSRKGAVRRQRITLGAVSLGLVVAIVFAVLALFARREAEKQAGKAQKQETIANEQKTKAQGTSVQADFDLSQMYRQKAETIEPRMLAHLARALRTDGRAALPRQYLISLLRDRPWYLPPFPPLQHGERVFAASFSADGRRVVTASWDKTVRIWDVETGRQVGDSIRPETQILAAGMSPDGKRIVTVSADSTGRVWDVKSGKPIGEVLRHDLPPKGIFVPTGFTADSAIAKHTGNALGNPLQIGAAGFSPDGKRMVTACLDHAALIWDAETSRRIGTLLGHTGRITAASFSADGLRIVTASEDNCAQLWDANSVNPIGDPMLHKAQVLSARFSADGNRIVTASADRTARVWDAHLATALGEPLRHDGWVLAASFSPDGRRIVTASTDKTAGVWLLDPKSGAAVQDEASGKLTVTSLRHEDFVMAANFSADGRRIVTASVDHTARVWSAESGKALGNPLIHNGTVLAANFDATGRRIVTAAADSTARLWDFEEREPVPKPVPYDGMIFAASSARDRRRVVVGNGFNFPRLWNPENGKQVGNPLRPEQGQVGNFSPDGKYLVTASPQGTVRVWDAEDGKPLKQLLHKGPVHAANFSPDGRWIVSASSDKTARVWETESDRLTGDVLQHEAAVTLAVFANSRRIVTACEDGTVQMWDAKDHKPIGQAMKHDNQVMVTNLSEVGGRLVTGSLDKTARVWELETGKPLCDPLPHESGVTSASFSKDGRRIVTVSGNETVRVWTVRVWDVATGKLAGEPVRHEVEVVAASLSADGRRVVTASKDRTERLWDTESGKPISEPVRQSFRIVGATFSADGRQIVTSFADGAIRTWDIAADLESRLPDWLPELAEALGGRRFDEDGRLVSPNKTIFELRKELLALQGDDFWSRFGRWFFTRGPERTISPDSRITVGETERLRLGAKKEGAE